MNRTVLILLILAIAGGVAALIYTTTKKNDFAFTDKPASLVVPDTSSQSPSPSP